MKYSTLFYYCLLSAIATLFSCGDDDNQTDCLVIEGEIVTEIITVPEFHGISFAGVGNVFLTQGESQEVKILTHLEILNLLEVEVTDQIIEIGLDGCIEGDIDQLDVFITTPELKLLTMAGVSNIVMENSFELDSLNVVLSGVGDITLDGSVEFLSIVSAGVGNINAFDMTSEVCQVILSGTGNMEVTANSQLDVTISGTGNVSYKGTPTIEAGISGSGNVLDAN